VIDVSVLTPALDYGRFIEDGIMSVNGQEGLSIEHVVQDGGSADETIEVLRRHSGRLQWTSEPDRGQSDALNRAFQRSSGRWIGWLNADEFYLPGGLKALVRHGDRTGVDVVYGDTVFVDQQGRLTRLLPQHPFSHLILRLYGCFISSSSTVFRRSVLPDQPWDIDVRRAMDWDLFLNLASRKARFSHIPYPAAAFRRHRQQVTARPSSEFGDEDARIMDRYEIDRRMRPLGPWLHAAYKLVSGAYGRQRRADLFRGVDLRWFHHREAFSSFEAFLSGCYREAI
jgi:glycosyltransferase involved in cell wall biosynthesis